MLTALSTVYLDSIEKMNRASGMCIVIHIEHCIHQVVFCGIRLSTHGSLGGTTRTSDAPYHVTDPPYGLDK